MQVEPTGLNPSSSNNNLETVTRKTAQYVGMTTGYVQGHSFDEMLEDANRLIRRFPEHSMIVAAAAGLLLGTALRRR